MISARRARTPLVALLALALAGVGLLVPQTAQAAPAPTTVTMTVNATTTQDGRIFRNSVASGCGTSKAYPTLGNPGMTYNYATTTYVAPTTGCLVISRSNATCAGAGPDSGNVHLSVYEAYYLPDFQSGHYLGDQGGSSNENTIGIDVVKGHTYVVAATNTTSQQDCTVDVTFTPTADATPPDTVITRGPSTKVRDAEAVLVFTGDPGGDTASFQCKVDKAAFAACTSPLVVSDLSDGQHTLAVAAVDEFGNADASPAATTFLSCDLLDRTLALKAATSAQTKADKAAAKATKAVAKAKNAKAKKAAKKKAAKAAKAAKKAKAKAARLQRRVLDCAS